MGAPRVDVSALTPCGSFGREPEPGAVRSGRAGTKPNRERPLPLIEDPDRAIRSSEPGAGERAQVEWHLAREQGDAYGDALRHAARLAAGDSGECRTGDYWITYLLDSPRRIHTSAEGKPPWHEPEGADLYVGIAVRDATDGRFIPAMSVGVTLIDGGGTVVGAGDQSLVWDPLAYQYGRNWHVEGEGPHSMRVRVEPLTRVQGASEQAMRPIEVEFSDLTLALRRSAGGNPGPGTIAREEPL